MSNSRSFFVILFLFHVHLDAYGQEQPASKLKTIIAEKFTVDIPVSWGFQLEERKGQFGAGAPNQKGMYPSPWLIIEFCAFDPDASMSGIKNCEMPCPSEDKARTFFDDEKFSGKMTSPIIWKQGQEIRYFQRLKESSAGGARMTSCSPIGLATAIILFENLEDAEFFESTLHMFRWK